jgi:hypothetical protein
MRMVYEIPDMLGQTAIVPDPLPAARFVAGQFGGDGVSGLERLAMYEQRLSRGLHAAIRELNVLRKLRDGRDEEDDDGGDGVAQESSEPIANMQADFGEPSRAAVGAARGDVDSAQNKPTGHEPCDEQATDSPRDDAAAQPGCDGRMHHGHSVACRAVQNKATEHDEADGPATSSGRDETAVNPKEGGSP